MSLSFRSAAPFLCLCAALCASSASLAQQSYIIPRVEAGAEWDTNRELVPDNANPQSSSSYRALLEARLGRRTPRTDTELRPRLVVQEFPDRKGIDAVEAFLDVHSAYHSPRTDASVEGQYARQDTINAELGQAQFDPAHPGDPQTGDTGVVSVGSTRTSFYVEPVLTHQLTERMGIESSFRYQYVSYDTNASSQSLASGQVGYNYGWAGVSLTQRFSPRTLLAIGPYYTRYEASNNLEQSDGYGVTFDLKHEWSEVSYALFSLSGERSESTEFQPARTDSSSTNWGLQFTGYTRYRVGFLRYSVGRFLTPSTLGSRREVDQVRVEYTRPLSPLMAFVGAVRYWKDRQIGDLQNLTGDGNRARADFTLSRQITSTWTVALAYRYAWQDIDTNSDSASNHMAILTISFRGRDPVGKVFDDRIRKH